VKAGRYLHPIVKAVRMMASHFGDRLVSVCLYGSVARGEAQATSDIDLLVVLESLDGSPVESLRAVYGCLGELRLERRFLLRHGVATDVSIYPLAREEARRFYPIYLDVAEDGIILYDVGGFFARLQFQAVGTLINSGGVKVRSRGEWFWRMPKDFVFGEPIGLPPPR
jgi:predicted nucleotidyltransferase